MKLELIRLDSQKPPIVLEQFPVIEGLDPGADVCLDDSSIGHYQCMIDDSDDVLTVWDLGTKQGTHINGIRVARTAPLHSGDELAIGRHRFRVEYGNGAARPPRAVDHDVPTSRQIPVSAPHRRPAVPV